MIPKSSEISASLHPVYIPVKTKNRETMISFLRSNNEISFVSITSRILKIYYSPRTKGMKSSHERIYSRFNKLTI